MKPFPKGNKLAKGGARPGAGRNVELLDHELSIIRQDYPLTVVSAFRRFRLWLTQDTPLNSPLWEREKELKDDAWRVINKWLPDAPKELEINGQVNHLHLLTQLKSLESKYPEPYIDLETQESGANGSSKPPSTNGSKTSALPGTQSELTQNKKTELPVSSVTEEASPSSSPVLGQSTLERLKTPE